MERLTNELHGDSKIYLLTLEIANLKRLSEMMREAIQAKCTDCCSVIAEKYFHMEQFCKRCPLVKYRENTAPEENLLATYGAVVNNFVNSRKEKISL